MRTIVAALTMAMAAGAAGAEPIMLDLQANHPNDSVLIVKSMERGPDCTRWRSSSRRRAGRSS